MFLLPRSMGLHSGFVFKTRRKSGAVQGPPARLAKSDTRMAIIYFTAEKSNGALWDAVPAAAFLCGCSDGAALSRRSCWPSWSASPAAPSRPSTTPTASTPTPYKNQSRYFDIIFPRPMDFSSVYAILYKK